MVKTTSLLTAFCVLTHLAIAADFNIKGKITDGTAGLSGAKVSLIKYPTITATSGSDGAFVLTGTIPAIGTIAPELSHVNTTRFGMAGNSIRFDLYSEVKTGSVSIHGISGKRMYSASLVNCAAGTHLTALPELANGFYLLHIVLDGKVSVARLVGIGSMLSLTMDSDAGSLQPLQVKNTKSIVAAPVDSLLVTLAGYKKKTVPLASYTKDSLPIALEKESVASCGSFKIPAIADLKANPKFPDPFKFIDGTIITKKADWPCLRKQLIGLLSYSHGSLPDTIGEVTATYSTGKLTIKITNGSKSGTITANISKIPSGEGPFPAIITLGAPTIPTPAGIAEISLPQTEIANEKSRSGVYSQLYGSANAGSMLMWAWGVGRIIDGLEKTTGHKINPKRIGVTGCSRNGKGAMVCGAFEERIALTLPMEGGSGGISSWRIAKVENSNKSAHPDGCQTASQIIGESGWLAPQFDQFAKETVALDKLPNDAHTLAAICAPRGLYFVEGSMNSWNCNVCCWTAASAAQMVYDALGVKTNIGLVMTDHNHCSGYSSAETTAYTAFCKKFLLDDQTVTTDFFTNDGKFDKLIDFTKWIDWIQPVLE